MEPFSSDPTVLVTGASGFLGSWIVFKLLEDGGYNVRALVHPKIKRSRLNTLKAIFENHSERVEFHKADILEYHDIHNHISGVEYVIHTAAPSPTSPLKPHEENMTEVGITGTINVLKSCISSDVKRVVITLSSSNCTDYIKGDGNYTFSDYTEIHSGMNPFILSKIKTEQEVKEFMAAMNKKTRTFDTWFILPSLIIGRPLMPEIRSGSLKMFQYIMQGKLTSIPQVYFSFIDVQDAVTAHINALKRGKHLGRYPLSNGNFKLSEYVQILAEQYKADGYSIPTGEMGICRVYFGSFFNDDALKYYHMWNIKAEVEGTHAENSLKFEYTKSAEESLMDMGDYFIDHGLI